MTVKGTVYGDESTDGNTVRNLDQSVNIVTHGSQLTLSQPGAPAETNTKTHVTTTNPLTTAAEMLKRREELEAREAKANKADFITYCSDVLTQHKQPNQGLGMPNKKDKYKVLQKVGEDQKELQKGGPLREPTVAEYGTYLESEIDQLRYQGVDATPTTKVSD